MNVRKREAKGYRLLALSVAIFLAVSAGFTQTVHAAAKVPSTTINSVSSPKSGTLSVSWKKAKNISGYQVAYAPDKNFKKGKKVKTVKKKSTGVTLQDLSKGKRYYVKVRAYKIKKGKKVYGKYSKAKSIKIKGNSVENQKKYCGYYTKYYGEKAENSPQITVHIKRVAKGKVTFKVMKVGRNSSPIYETATITAKLKEKKASFKWTDSWGNKGKGTLIIGTKSIKLNLKQTERGGFNRSTLDTGGTITLTK